jgi:cell division protein FtsB
MLGMGGAKVSRPSRSSRPAVRRTSAGSTPHLLARLVTPLLLVVAAVGAVVIVAVPTQSHLERTASINSAQQQLTELVARNEADSIRLAALRTDEEVEHRARRDFGLARPGEEIYRVLAPAEDPPRIPNTWPFNHLSWRQAVE